MEVFSTSNELEEQVFEEFEFEQDIVGDPMILKPVWFERYLIDIDDVEDVLLYYDGQNYYDLKGNEANLGGLIRVGPADE